MILRLNDGSGTVTATWRIKNLGIGPGSLSKEYLTGVSPRRLLRKSSLNQPSEDFVSLAVDCIIKLH